MSNLLDLSVIGTAVRLHRNDEVAQYFDNGYHLISHETQSVAASPEELNVAPEHTLGADPSGKEGVVLIDRYDVRSLLQECDYYYAVAKEQKKTDSDFLIYVGDELDNTLVGELMKERFGTLPEYEDIFCCPKTTLSSESHDASPIVAATKCKTDRMNIDAPLILTSEEQSQLPVGIILPQSKRQYQIICMAAEKSIATPQFEILLKVKQSDHEDFGFLQEGDMLNPLYLFLKERQQLQNREVLDSACVSKKPVQRESRMLVEYDSSSSDGENCDVGNGQLSINSSLIGSVLKQEDDEMVAEKEKIDITRSVSEEQNLLPERCELSKQACRLKRARLLKSHFSSQMKDSIK